MYTFTDHTKVNIEQADAHWEGRL